MLLSTQEKAAFFKCLSTRLPKALGQRILKDVLFSSGQGASFVRSSQLLN